MLEWMPIESAPRDGTEFIGLAGTGVFQSVYLMYWVACNHDWYSQQLDYEERYILDDVTFWIPMPSVPLTASHPK